MLPVLTDLIARFPGRRILLVGDFMLDRYIVGDVERISPEAPVPVARVLERKERVGGAGSVAMNVRALDAHVHCFGLLGMDLYGERVLSMLSRAGVDVSGIARTDERPTITKTRVIGLAEHRHQQQLLRIDDEIIAPVPDAIAADLLKRFEAALPHADVVCLEDYAKGLLTPAFCAKLIAAARKRGAPVLIDPARSASWDQYRGATSMTPNRNELEAGFGARLGADEVEGAAADIIERLELESLVVTLGRDGALLVRKDGTSARVPTVPRAVYDNTGAGDAVLAAMAVALAAGASDVQAVQLANIAGGLEVEKFGCVPITREEMLNDLQRDGRRGRGKLRSAAELQTELEARRQRGETVVFTNGCFDLLHPGHVELLESAKQQGSVLVVGLNSDASVRRQNKGDDRPIRREADRVRMLAALECVDFVIVFDADTPIELIRQLSPDVLIKGSDWAGKGVVGQEIVEARGGRVALVQLVEGYSTTGELAKIRGEAAGRR